MNRTNQRVKNGIVAPAVKQYAVAEDSLADRPRLLRGSLARHVVDGGNDLEAQQIGLAKGEVGKAPDGGRRHATSGRRGADPVAQIGDAVITADLVEAATAEKARGTVSDDEVVLRPIAACQVAGLDPRLGFLKGVAGVTPKEPGKDLVNRLRRCFEELRRIGCPIRTN